VTIKIQDQEEKRFKTMAGERRARQHLDLQPGNNKLILRPKKRQDIEGIAGTSTNSSHRSGGDVMLVTEKSTKKQKGTKSP